MTLSVTPEAASWYIRELNLKPGDSLKFFGKVYGPHGGFSFAISKQEPNDPLMLISVSDVNFYIEAFDEWFFGDKDLHITMRPDGSEPEYTVINH